MTHDEDVNLCSECGEQVPDEEQLAADFVGVCAACKSPPPSEEEFDPECVLLTVTLRVEYMVERRFADRIQLLPLEQQINEIQGMIDDYVKDEGADDITGVSFGAPFPDPFLIKEPNA